MPTLPLFSLFLLAVVCPTIGRRQHVGGSSNSSSSIRSSRAGPGRRRSSNKASWDPAALSCSSKIPAFLSCLSTYAPGRQAGEGWVTVFCPSDWLNGHMCLLRRLPTQGSYVTFFLIFTTPYGGYFSASVLVRGLSSPGEKASPAKCAPRLLSSLLKGKSEYVCV